MPKRPELLRWYSYKSFQYELRHFDILHEIFTLWKLSNDHNRFISSCRNHFNLLGGHSSRTNSRILGLIASMTSIILVFTTEQMPVYDVWREIPSHYSHWLNDHLPNLAQLFDKLPLQGLLIRETTNSKDEAIKSNHLIEQKVTQ